MKQHGVRRLRVREEELAREADNRLVAEQIALAESRIARNISRCSHEARRKFSRLHNITSPIL